MPSVGLVSFDDKACFSVFSLREAPVDAGVNFDRQDFLEPGLLLYAQALCFRAFEELGCSS